MFQNSYYRIVLTPSGNTGNYAELDTEGIDFSAKFQVSDIADITTRKDAITKTLSFKATKNNNLIFGNLTNLNRYVDETVNLPILFNFDITKDIPCQVFENSTLIFSGKLHFISTSRDAQGNVNYDCDIEGYAIGLFQDIQNLLISDLDFSSFNHTYDIANISNSWSNIYMKNGVTVSGTTGQGYVYPCIDYGESIINDPSFDNKMDYRNFRPAFFIKEYFNAIFTQTGLTGNYTYTITGSTAFMEEFNKCIVPNNDSDFSYVIQPLIIFGIAKKGQPQRYTGKQQTTFDKPNNRNEYNNLITFDTITTGATGQSVVNPSLINNQKFVFNNRINTSVSASVTFQIGQILSKAATVRFQCLYRDADNGQFNSIGEVTKNYAEYGGFDELLNPVATLNLTATNTFQQGGEMAFVVFVDSQSPSTYAVAVLNAQVSIGSDSSTSLVTLKLGDKAVLLGQNTQTLSQTDFLKSYINMFNLYVYPNPDMPTNIIFTPYNDFYFNFKLENLINSAIDWTDKIDNSSFTQTPVTNLFDLYKFNFAEDSDYFSKLYKDKYGDTYGNLILTGTTNGTDKSLDLIFGSTPVANYNNRNIPYLWELDTNNLKKVKVTVPRILFYNGLVSSPTYEIGLVSLSASTQTYYFSHLDSANIANYTFGQYAEANEFTISSDGEFADLTFGNPLQVYYTNGGILSNYGSGKKNLYDRYYADFITELTDSNTRVVQVKAYLNEIDIQNLDFTKPIYFNSSIGHNYFKLLSVEYSNKNEASTVTLQTSYIKDDNIQFLGYNNDTQSAYFNLTGCTSGYTGEAMLYAVPGGKYNSLLSQTDADNMALAEIAASGQTYVDTYGMCINTSASWFLKYGAVPTDTRFASYKSYYTNTGTLTTGSTLFYSSGTTSRGNPGYYTDGTNFYLTDNTTTIISTATTSATSATTYEYFFSKDSNQYLSCQDATNGQNSIYYYLSDPSPKLGTVIKDSTNTVYVADAFYSDGYNAYQTSGGIVINVYTCNTLPSR